MMHSNNEYGICFSDTHNSLGVIIFNYIQFPPKKQKK